MIALFRLAMYVHANVPPDQVITLRMTCAIAAVVLLMVGWPWAIHSLFQRGRFLPFLAQCSVVALLASLCGGVYVVLG